MSEPFSQTTMSDKQMLSFTLLVYGGTLYVFGVATGAAIVSVMWWAS
jgi:hypothetical protein